jgi:DNA-binding CsgD family transcriptional regulator
MVTLKHVTARHPESIVWPNLSDRQRACLQLLAEGELDEAIGIRLKISGRTVRFHIDNAKRTLKARNRVHLIAMALSASWLDPIGPYFGLEDVGALLRATKGSFKPI